MRNYPGTRPEKAASGVEGDPVPPVPARGKLTSGLEFPATARGELQEGTGHAKSETVFNPKNQRLPPLGQGAGVPGKTPRWGSGDCQATAAATG